jgi:hypothetical protein
LPSIIYVVKLISIDDEGGGVLDIISELYTLEAFALNSNYFTGF